MGSYSFQPGVVKAFRVHTSGRRLALTKCRSKESTNSGVPVKIRNKARISTELLARIVSFTGVSGIHCPVQITVVSQVKLPHQNFLSPSVLARNMTGGYCVRPSRFFLGGCKFPARVTVMIGTSAGYPVRNSSYPGLLNGPVTTFFNVKERVAYALFHELRHVWQIFNQHSFTPAGKWYRLAVLLWGESYAHAAAPEMDAEMFASVRLEQWKRRLKNSRKYT